MFVKYSNKGTMIVKLQRIYKEVVRANYVLSPHLSGETTENHERKFCQDSKRPDYKSRVLPLDKHVW
jgi:hypothetical protein